MKQAGPISKKRLKVEGSPISRKAFSGIFLALIFLASLNLSGEAQGLAPDRSRDIVQIARKIDCSIADGKPALHWWRGKVFSRIPGERDRHLFNVQGFRWRICIGVQNSRRGTGYRSIAREMQLFFAPQTGQLLQSWKNPWSGEEVEVMQIAKDPVLEGPVFADSLRPVSSGLFEIDGHVLLCGMAIRSFSINPLAGNFQMNIGGRLHTLDAWSSGTQGKSLFDTNNPEVKNQVVSWLNVSKWLPWMKMGDRPGIIVIHAAGMRLNRFEDLPEEIKEEVRRNWPGFQIAPTMEDSRPGMTMEAQFNQWVEARKKTPRKKP
jgi:hypothetical protein